MNPGPAARLFVALWPSAAERDALAARQSRWHWPARARLVPPAKLHVTLHFLGNVPVGRVAEFRDALAAPFEPHALPLHVAREGVWPGGIAVLAFDAPPALQRLHDELAGRLRSLGWPVETRRFRPHVTLARHAQGASPPASPPADLRWEAAAGYVLARSGPSRGYELLHAYT